jgi:hypothetical protein
MAAEDQAAVAVEEDQAAVEAAVEDQVVEEVNPSLFLH